MNAEILAAFLGDARDLLEQINTLSLALEHTPEEPDTLHALFRAVHTLKGASGFFEAQPLTEVIHAGEDLLGAVRDGTHALSAQDMDALLAAMDQVGAWLDELEHSGALGDDAAARAQPLVRALRGANAAQAQMPDAEAPSDAPAWLEQVPAAARQALAAHGGGFAIDYRPHEQCFFHGQDPLQLIAQLPGLVWWSIHNREPWPAPEAFDPYRCVLQIRALTQADEPTLQPLLRAVRDQITLTPLPAARLAGASEPEPEPEPEPAPEPAPDPAPAAPADSAPLNALALLRAQRHSLLIRPPAAPWPGRLASVITVLQRVLPALSTEPWGERIDAAAAEAQQAHSVAPVLALLDAVLVTLAAPDATETPDAAEAPAPAPEPALEPEPAPAPETAPEPEPARLSLNVRGRLAPARPADDNRPRVLKVEAARIDALMDLVGELIVAKNALPFLAKRADEAHANAALGKAIKAQSAVINRIAEDLQGAVMQARMVPLGSAFQRFPRLVRDCARTLGKEVELVIEGEATEADKNVVADLADPLLHLVRNALDHGLEAPAQRRAAGKPEACRLQIKAQQHEDRVLIEVSDDGRGMDAEAIKRKAHHKGLISAEALARLAPQEALQLVFEPGFSTASSVSELSGRGVGMDVVRSAVQRAGGEVRLHSEPGLGTTVGLSVPLSMTVTQVMRIGVGGADFGLVFETVHEIVRLPAAQVQHIKAQETALLRERLLPLYRLDQLLGLEAAPAPDAASELTILVSEVAGQALGLIVDEVCEGVDVILKPLEGVMAQFPIYSGSALLGDGRVLLVLNLEELLRCR